MPRVRAVRAAGMPCFANPGAEAAAGAAAFTKTELLFASGQAGLTVGTVLERFLEG